MWKNATAPSLNSIINLDPLTSALFHAMIQKSGILGSDLKLGIMQLHWYKKIYISSKPT